MVRNSLTQLRRPSSLIDVSCNTLGCPAKGKIAKAADGVFAMTKPFIPHVFTALTTSVVHDRSDPRTAAVSFPADADFYSFVLDRAALARLGRQIERVLREMPPPERKR